MRYRIWAALLMAALACASALAEAGGLGEEAPELSADAGAYVLVSTATQAGWLALPDEQDCTYPLVQTRPDGTQTLNLIHLTSEGVYMEDSTCENRDCVEQGMVTLENRDERILSNMIICLPNQVFLRLFTPEEYLRMTAGDEAH